MGASNALAGEFIHLALTIAGFFLSGIFSLGVWLVNRSLGNFQALADRIEKLEDRQNDLWTRVRILYDRSNGRRGLADYDEGRIQS